ncbi:zinc ABC transporter substrate-binding protein ZnuA [Proteus vulgaris]|uniref:zinc ABC transporter substrate-binding protein ZnuA n=1 Tax=Proteus TaxID=583 RepID=UPI0032DB40CA
MLHKNNKFAHRFLLKSFLATIIISSFSASVQADVVASIRPIGFIAAAIADGVTPTEVLLPDGASPHDYALKPSDLKKITSADLMVWIGPDMEVFLDRPLNRLTDNHKLALAETNEIKSLLLKDDDDNVHKHEENHEHHSHGDYNMHIWLSPEIALSSAKQIHERLIALYPDKKELLDVNLGKFSEQLKQTDKNLVNILSPVRNKGYFVFHDAYGYFEKHYNLKPLGHFTINPEIQPGAQKLHQIRTQLVEQKATCIFAEPQFRPTVIETVAKGTGVKMGVLDPLGSGIALTQESYVKFLTQLANQYASCLNETQ